MQLNGISILRVSNQNGISLQWYRVKICHSSCKPSISLSLLVFLSDAGMSISFCVLVLLSDAAEWNEQICLKCKIVPNTASATGLTLWGFAKDGLPLVCVVALAVVGALPEFQLNQPLPTVFLSFSWNWQSVMCSSLWKISNTEKAQVCLSTCRLCLQKYISSVSDQNGISLLYIMLEIHHSGW